MKPLLRLLKPYFVGDKRAYAISMGSFLIALSLSKVYVGFLFAEWNKRFYDALEAKNTQLFQTECFYFAGLAVLFMLLFSFSRYFGQRYALHWRIWMTDYALSRWLPQPNRDSVEGPDQRIQEDLMRFTDIFERHVLEIFNSIVLIVTFTPVLFKLTSDLTYFGHKVPGLLFYIIVVYTLVGMKISKTIADPLVTLEYDGQKLEAEFRYNLVRARDGEERSKESFLSIFKTITENHNAIYKRQKYFNIWQKSYGQLSFLIPFLTLAPGFFSGFLSFGILMQTRSFFSRIRNSMAYLLDHYTEITEFFAVVKRLDEFFLST